MGETKQEPSKKLEERFEEWMKKFRIKPISKPPIEQNKSGSSDVYAPGDPRPRPGGSTRRRGGQ